ncbi:MAG: hypothetical protein ACR2PG_16260 [Hyphomicrobiaceae bacterium]
MVLKLAGKVTLVVLALSLPISAQANQNLRNVGIEQARLGGDHTRHIDRRIRRQNKRIRKGRRVGDLTVFEYRRLRFRMFQIRNARRLVKLDGVVSFRERRRLHRLLDRNSDRIRRLRNNGRFAYFGFRNQI